MKIIRINALWCPACLISKNAWKEIEKKYPNLEYIDYDYDMDENIVQKYNVKDILPVVIVMQNEKELKRIIGEKNKQELLNELKDVLWKKYTIY